MSFKTVLRTAYYSSYSRFLLGGSIAIALVSHGLFYAQRAGSLLEIMVSLVAVVLFAVAVSVPISVLVTFIGIKLGELDAVSSDGREDEELQESAPAERSPRALRFQELISAGIRSRLSEDLSVIAIVGTFVSFLVLVAYLQLTTGRVASFSETMVYLLAVVLLASLISLPVLLLIGKLELWRERNERAEDPRRSGLR